MANTLILTKAENAITAHDWETAVRLYKELLRDDETNIEYLNKLGSIFVRSGQDEKAIQFYEQIITLQNDNIDAMVSLGGIYRRLKRYNNSVSILKTAQKIAPNNFSISYSLGFTYKEMGTYNEAIDAFESVLNQNPKDVLAYNHLGSIYTAQKDNQKAIAAFKKGLQVDPNHPILNYNLAIVYEKLKNFPEAVRHYETALKTRPGWVDAIRDFSELLIRCQNTKPAQVLVEQSIKLHPGDVDLLCILGRIYLNQFDFDNAAKTFKSADNLRQNDIDILLGLSKALEKGSKIDDAMEKVLQAVDLDSKNLEAAKQYAHILLSGQHYEKALEVIKKLDEITGGKEPQVLDLYAQYFVCRGEDEAAAAYFERIQNLNQNYKEHLINAASRYIQTGNYDKAEEFAAQVVDKNPQLPDGYNLLGTIQTARGELTKAKSEFEKGLSLKNPNIYAAKELAKINQEIKKNQALYNDENAAIEIDAEKENLNSENQNEENDQNEMEKLAEPSEEAFDISQMGDLSSLDKSLAEDSDDFWEDFDDDPELEKKPLADEENSFDENSGDEDFMSLMTPEASGEEENSSLENQLLKDNEPFDFSDFEENSAGAENSDIAQTPEPEPQVQPSQPSSQPQVPQTPLQQPFQQAMQPAPQQPVQQSSMPQPQPQNPQSLQNPPVPQPQQMPEPQAPNIPESPHSFNDFSDEVESAEEFEPASEIMPEIDASSNLANEEAQTVPEDDDLGLYDSDFSQKQEPLPEPAKTSVQNKNQDKNALENRAALNKSIANEFAKNTKGISTDDMLNKIERILNDDDFAKSNAAELELFKKLRTLSAFLPEKEKSSYNSCRMRMVIEYIISKLSGKPGLLKTAESLIKSGVLGEEYNRQLDDVCDEELSNDLIRRVIIVMKKLSQDLEDKDLTNALCVSADAILEQIALIDQKCSIF